MQKIKGGREIELSQTNQGLKSVKIQSTSMFNLLCKQREKEEASILKHSYGLAPFQPIVTVSQFPFLFQSQNVVLTWTEPAHSLNN